MKYTEYTPNKVKKLKFRKKKVEIDEYVTVYFKYTVQW